MLGPGPGACRRYPYAVRCNATGRRGGPVSVHDANRLTLCERGHELTPREKFRFITMEGVQSRLNSLFQ
eukprot:3082928-Prymnesium_polylepis.1